MKIFFTLFFFVAFAASNLLFAQPIFINEIEYSEDDTPTSSDGVGIFGPVGQDLSGYSIQIVSSSGTNITVIPLTGTISAGVPVTNRGEIWIEVPVLNVSNGDQGIVLIAPGTTVEQFVSFGNANSIITTNIAGAGTITSDYVGFHVGGKSLQVTGTGCEYTDFAVSSNNAYINTQAPSHGNINENQIVDCVDDGSTDNVVLPVELLRFSGKVAASSIELEWVTVTERNNDFFTLEHSTDGEAFAEINRTVGSGDTETMKHYSYTDTEAETGVNYYRLKQTDFDGKETYFGIIQINRTAVENQPQIYPNPARESVTIKFPIPVTKNFHLEIYNIFGETVMRKQVGSYAESIELNVSDLAPGMYFVDGDQDGKRINQSFLKK